MKIYSGHFFEAISRKVEFVTQAENEDEARANVTSGNASFEIDEDYTVPLIGYSKNCIFDDPREPVTLSPEDAEKLCDLLDTLASHAGDEGLGSDLAVDIESARKLLQP